MKNPNDLTYDENERVRYKALLQEYKSYLSDYHWHLHITLRQGYSDSGYTFCSRSLEGLHKRTKVSKEFLSKLRAKLRLKDNQLHYVILHEYESGGHCHILVQFTKVISKPFIYKCLRDLKEDYENKHSIIVHYRKGRSNRVWVVNQDNLVSYVTKAESNGIAKEPTTSEYLESHGVISE